jgi:hypothetical protein
MEPNNDADETAPNGGKADCLYTEHCSIGNDPIVEPDFEKTLQDRLDADLFAGLEDPADEIEVVSRIATFEEYRGPSNFQRNVMVKVRGALAKTIAEAADNSGDELEYVACEGDESCVVDIANRTSGYTDLFEISDEAGSKKGASELAELLSDSSEEAPLDVEQGPVSCQPGAYGDDTWQTCDFEYAHLAAETANDRALVVLTYNNTYEGDQNIGADARPPRRDYREGYFRTPERRYSTGRAPLRAVGSNVVQVLAVPRDLLQKADSFLVQNGPEARSTSVRLETDETTVSKSDNDARFAFYIPNFEPETHKEDGSEESDTANSLEMAVLELVNTASVDVLDDDVKLDSRAAENIVDYRLGEDGEQGTEDDRQFESIEQLRRIDYVADTAIEKLKTYVDSQ